MIMAKVSSLTDIQSIAAYLSRIGAEPRSLRTAVVKEVQGAYWRDIAIIRFTKAGDVDAPTGFEPTDPEAQAIKDDCVSADWPVLKKIKRVENPPSLWSRSRPDDFFYFHDLDGNIIMVQQRLEDAEKGKSYVPWTYWDDDIWRNMEPEGALPLWGLDQLKDYTTVFIHEGAKAARAVRRMVEGKTEADRERLKAHPWGEELSHAAHLGWIGGALSPARTDWSMIKKQGCTRAYIVSDNDAQGLGAVPEISRRLSLPTFHVQFTSEWPASFDLADPFPKKMFKKMGDTMFYVGPSFRSCLHPATFATSKIPQAKGKPIIILREEFKDMWAYVEEVDVFVCKEMPNIIRNDKIMNNMLAPFSDVAETSRLIVKAYRGRNTKLCYRPDIPGRIVTDGTTSAINLHVPTHIKSIPGDAGPWIEFMEYMFPDPKERHDMLRWCATLIARPEIKMDYGVLLVSETQGVGKTTLGAKILAELVGKDNTGFPNEDDIVNSQFNGWLANKRLIIIGEIYSGHSWKAYNKLKSYITDKDIEFNQKYQRPYRVDNWAHIMASSNSKKALKMEEKDRRWFYPTVTEQKWDRAHFAALHEWLGSGGLSIIKAWAEGFGEYVVPGEAPPMTKAKKDMISESRSESAAELADLCEAIRNDRVEVVLAMKDVTSWLKMRVGASRVFDSDYELRKTASDFGFKTFDKRVKIGGTMQYVIMSPAFRNRFPDIEKLGDDDIREATGLLRAAVKAPGEMMQSII